MDASPVTKALAARQRSAAPRICVEFVLEEKPRILYDFASDHDGQRLLLYLDRHPAWADVILRAHELRAAA